ncbi:BcPKS5, polyketide synthase [Parachaetomium inaequale]|uniref:BcPKS5, polyketide synthase n=1 Tax=Parachaetomium inaequale TaxID=2588326 RepID=A0AAN6P884_9PEZI|nr:BcPKS5, polyketide synthase [Parachaetomium inaequale]
MAPQDQNQEPIAVIGMACRFPGGCDSPSKLWDLLRAPRDLTQRIPADRFDIAGFYHSNGSHHGATDAQKAYFLEQDVTQFDNAFFNVPAAEAEAMDPQQRLLMETVYDSLCAAGQKVEDLRGSDTAAYVGLMCDDWAQVMARDWDQLPTYVATGVSRAIVANRLSYFFDWRGPSMTIDTACSSSLVAVHQGVTALRNGECRVAVAAGVNLILAPGMFIGESKLHMLSPTGTGKMWDAAADGYARGEGVASVVLKPLSAALRDGDHVDCIIRGTAVNQDGKTVGMTVPSNQAQAALIREAYARAGLDINDIKDRPQFFHAHGTGTQAGDPQEAEAISQSFFGDGKVTDTLYVGSIKTIIGHTEGAAGLASLIGSALAMQKGVIPPNLHFESLSARVAPYYTHLEVPTAPKPWPRTLAGQPRRVSVNSFGFGGTNAHAILEYFEPEPSPAPTNNRGLSTVGVPSFTPLLLSAASPSALRAALSDLRGYLDAHPDTDMRSLAYTLQTRRSTLGYRKAIAAGNVEEAIKRIDGMLDSSDADVLTRYHDITQPSILGIFTGQGAQWPRMGARLLQESPFASQRLAELQRALATLPAEDRPNWTLSAQLLADPQTSRVAEAAVSQPLCTAVQIVLVDMVRAAGLKFRAVVGHSSGEIAAAYAARFLSAGDAMRVAYYRGLFAGLASGLPALHHDGDEVDGAGATSGCRGAMMAVGTSYEDALAFCQLDDFAGRIQVAARNSPTSITLSGDEDAVEEAVAIFKDENKFARRLTVDTAYHSTHMLPCEAPYLAGLARAGYGVGDGDSAVSWFSSVVGGGGHVMTKEDVQTPQYWADNMTSPVLFAPAVLRAVGDAGPFDIAIELGPHPALKGPALDTIEAATGKKIPYTGLLRRAKDDVEELALALGYIWTQLGVSSVNFDAFENLVSGVALLPKQQQQHQQKRPLGDLPSYPFDRPRSFSALSRFSGGHRHLHAPPHPLLGRRMVEAETADTVAWRNILRPSEISWIQGHGLQGQNVFPAMGFVSLAVEAIAAVTATAPGGDRQLGLITLRDVVIGRALAFADENVGVEIKVGLRVIRSDNDGVAAHITCHSGLPLDASGTPLALNFSAAIAVDFHDPMPDTLPAVRHDEVNLVDAATEMLYSQFAALGYSYAAPFTGVRSIRRKMGWATGELEDEAGDAWEDQLLVHPGWLDSAVQTGFAAYTHPLDNRLHALLVPTAIRSIVINPFFFSHHGTTTATGSSGPRPPTRALQYQTTARVVPDAPIAVDIDVFAGSGDDGAAASHAFVQFDTLKVMYLATPTARDDAVMFSRFNYRPATLDAAEAVEQNKELVPRETAELWRSLDRIGFFYLRRLYETLTQAERDAALPHYQYVLDYAGRLLDMVQRGECAAVPRDALHDTPAFIRSLMGRYHGRADVQITEAVGENMAAEIRRGGSLLEHMMKDGLLDRFYADGAGVDTANRWIARVMGQLAHRYPRMNLFEVGAGTGSATRQILGELRGAFSTYTFTDIGAGFLSRAQDAFADNEYADRMAFATFDMERAPEEQGFVAGTYDVVIASNVLHATGKLDDALTHVRRLLRPGGYLVALEIVCDHTPVMNLVMGGMPGWWAGAMNDATRRDGPCLTLEKWDALARRHGFGGVDSHVPVVNKQQWFSVFACQAVDDRVNSLREPLAVPGPNSTDLYGDGARELVIIGGRTPSVRQLADDIVTLLGPHYTEITRIAHPEELNSHHQPDLEPGTAVLSLTELDEQLLETRTAAKLEALKTLFRNAGSILWVTRGARDERPFSSLMLGLSRVVRLEYPNINLQLLDFDATTEMTSQSIAEALVRLELGGRYAKEGALLWTVEPETHYEKGRLLVPRLMPDVQANLRYNAYRRPVFDDFALGENTVVLEPTPDGAAFELAAVSPLRVSPTPPPTARGSVVLRVEQSLLQVVKVGDAGYLTLLVGTDVANGHEKLVALADTAVESCTRVPVEWTARVTQSSNNRYGETLAASLVAVGSHLVAQSILAAAPRFGTVLVHEADELLRNALEREAQWEGMRVVYTTAAKSKTPKQQHQHGPYIPVHDKMSLRQARTLLPRDVSFLVNLASPASSDSSDTAVDCSDLFGRVLPPHIPKATAAQFVCVQPRLSPDADIDQVGSRLKAAWQAVTRRQQQRQQVATSLLPLQDITDTPVKHTKFAAVDWTASSSVRALVRPIDHGTIFRADGTYLLIGLAGDLGQSLCEWMVSRGARHVVIGSRRPNIDHRFLAALSAECSNACRIQVLPIDVTSRDSLRGALDAMHAAKMPPTIGVVNGAMVLEDMLFEDLDMPSLERTAPPKVDGSVLLDELFYDAPLDFFVLMTSTAQVVGNGGQSAYVMANQFMNALAAQRRDVRGVVGSNMAISFVYGRGYVEHNKKKGDSNYTDFLLRLTYRGISERDLHELFAETVLAGRPGARGVAEVATGVGLFRDEPQTHIQLRANPRFSHFMLHDAGAGSGAHGSGHGGANRTERLRVRLAAIKSLDEARGVVRDAFADRLRRILMLPHDTSVDPKASVIEQGVDSIMAVELRSWFLKELDIDMPVLKILGAGATVESLLGEILDKIPASILNLDSAASASVVASSSAVIPPPFIPPSPVGAPAAVASMSTRPASPRTSPAAATDTETETTDSNGTSSRQAGEAQDTPPESPPGTWTGAEDGPAPKDAAAQIHPQEMIRALEKQREAARRRVILETSTETKEPMTYGQKRFWFLHHYVDNPTAFNMAYQFRLEGRIRTRHLAEAVDAVTQRHEALRTRYFWADEQDESGTHKTPMQGILSKGLLRLETATIESEAQVAQELVAMRNHEWDLGDWGQVRLRLLSLSDTVHWLIMCAHHISMDGHSTTVLMADLNQAYQAYGLASSPPPPLTAESQARAFGRQQTLAYTSGKLQPAIDYYRQTLASVDLTRPIDLFPFARSQVRQPQDRHCASSVARLQLRPNVAARLKQLARAHRATSFHGYLAALQALIRRLLPSAASTASTRSTTRNNIVIGIADANRLDAQFLGSIGNLLNILPLVFGSADGRNKSGQDNNETFGQAIEAARSKVHSALEHSRLPFDVLLDELAVPRSNTYPPLCQVIVDYKLVTREQAAMRWAGCAVSDHAWLSPDSSYDVAVEIVEYDETALVSVHMQGGLYTQEAAELFLRSFENVLGTVTGDGGGDVVMDELEKWNVEDVKVALERGKGPEMHLEWPETVAHRIDQVIAQHPHDIAIKDGFGRCWTYAALDEQVDSIARVLCDLLLDQTRQGSVVGVFQTPAAGWIASLVAIMRVGAVYLPLDLKVSASRLNSYVKAAQPAVILTDDTMAGLTEDIGIEHPTAVVNISGLPATVPGSSSSSSSEQIKTAAQSQNPAYIIFTSGSTGTPKGVVVKHASFRAMAEGYVRQWETAGLGGVVLQQFPLTSDGSLKQIVSAITTGGCLVVAPAHARGDPTELTQLMAEEGVTCAVATPSEWSMWFRFALDALRRCTALTSAWFGGEKAPQSLLDSFRGLGQTLPKLRFFHTYGPTEATISTAKGEALLRQDSEVAIPVPLHTLPNYAVYIVDEESQPVPLGVPGEIIIGGAGVGHNEYLGRPDLTADRFLADHFAPHDSKEASGWGRMYRTGDYGRIDVHGRLTVEGRIAGDAQVKIRGFRVELGEIEAVILKEAAGALASAVLTLRDGEGDHDGLLVAHVVMQESNSTTALTVAGVLDQLRTRLALSLPQYMIPAVLVPVDEIPLTAHGKVDRNAVRDLALPEACILPTGQQEEGLLTAAERRLADTWATLLPPYALAAERLTRRTDFFRAGGNSLLLVKLQAAIKSTFGGEAPRLSKLMGAPELGSMATLLKPLLEGSGAAAGPDWDEEMALDFDLADLVPQQQRHQDTANGLCVLVTGATGLLGKNIMPLLVADAHIAQIIVLARHADRRDLTRLFPNVSDTNNKIRVIPTELPAIPAPTEAPELQSLDVILHLAADRNFWDGYAALKPVNVDAAKGLARLAMQTGSALHVLSSGAVADYEADADHRQHSGKIEHEEEGGPRPDPALGYVASKWAAERYLANAARQAGLRVTAHRPTAMSTTGKETAEAIMVGEDRAGGNNQLTEMEDALARSILSTAPQLGVRPDFNHISGALHVAPVDEVAAAVADAVARTGSDRHWQGSEVKAMRIINHPATASVRTEVVAARVEKALEEDGNQGVRALPSVPALQWVGMAKRAGVFKWFFAAQELVVTDDEGRTVVSKR